VTLLPGGASRDARLLLATRALRGFADGLVSVLLASYLTGLGFTPVQVGAVVTGTLLGSAAVTLGTGLASHRLGRKRVLLGASVLMLATGIGFAGATTFWPVLVIAVAGTLNPSAGDVSLFLPTEQAVLAEVAPAEDRTLLFAWYNLAGTFAGALGALASGLFAGGPAVQRAGFLIYALVAVAAGILYRTLGPAVEAQHAQPRRALDRSRRIVLHLAALFSLDSAGGGFVVQSLLALWLYRRFDLSMQLAGAFFFVAGLFAALSQLLSSRLAARIGLIPTMVYTHLPANLLLIAAGIVPSAPVALSLLLLRMILSSMDVPARQSFVMAVVPPEERAAASSVTNVPRSLAAALTPLLAGYLLSRTSFGWPLICGGALKALYDLLLLVQFRAVKPWAEAAEG
jgi:MFS family permease